MEVDNMVAKDMELSLSTILLSPGRGNDCNTQIQKQMQKAHLPINPL